MAEKAAYLMEARKLEEGVRMVNIPSRMNPQGPASPNCALPPIISTMSPKLHHLGTKTLALRDIYNPVHNY